MSLDGGFCLKIAKLKIENLRFVANRLSYLCIIKYKYASIRQSYRKTTQKKRQV